MYNRNNDNSNSYNNTATNVSVAAQQSTLLYLGAKVREVEKRLRKRDGVDLSGEDAYLCLEVLSLCSLPILATKCVAIVGDTAA